MTLVVTAAFGGYLLTGLSGVYLGAYRPPSFCLAFVCGFGLKWLCTYLRFTDTVDRTIMLRLSGALTDVLVVCGIAAVSLEVVAGHALPLLALFIFGLALCWAVFYVGGPRIFRDLWFEKALFTWGWVTGGPSPWRCCVWSTRATSRRFWTRSPAPICLWRRWKSVWCHLRRC